MEQRMINPDLILEMFLVAVGFTFLIVGLYESGIPMRSAITISLSLFMLMAAAGGTK